MICVTASKISSLAQTFRELVISCFPFHIREHFETKESGALTDKPFLTDIQTLRERARKHIEKGEVTEGYTADREISRDD